MDPEDYVAAAVLSDQLAELRELEAGHVRTLSQVRAVIDSLQTELDLRTRPIVEDGE